MSIECIKPGDAGPLSWIKNGSVKRIWLNEPKEDIYIYCVRGGPSICVSGSVGSIQQVLAIELTTSPELKPLVFRDLPKILFALMAHGDSVMIDNAYAMGYLHKLDDFPPEKRSILRKRTAERLSECAASSFVKAEGSAWTMTFYSTDTAGALNQWRASGEEEPFCIKEFEIRRIEDPGALEPYRRIW